MGNNHDRDPSSSSDVIASSPRPESAPGKRTLTERHRVRAQGTLPPAYGCEDDELAHGAGECFLTARERDNTRVDLLTVVGSSMGNFATAIQNRRIDLLTLRPESWGPLAEFLFYSLTGPLIGLAVTGLKAVRVAAAARDAARLADAGLQLMRGMEPERASGLMLALSKVPDEDMKAFLTNVSRSARKALMKGGNGNRDKAEFLKLLQETVKPLTDEVVIAAPKQLSDTQLLALVGSYADREVHSIAAYEERIADLLTRYDRQGVDQAGEGFKDGGVMRPIVLRSFGQRRTAMLAEHGTGEIGTYGAGEARGEVMRGDGIDYFVSFVDDDLAPMATAIYQGRRPGAAIEEIDVADGVQGLPFKFFDETSMAKFSGWVTGARRQHRQRASVGPVPKPQVDAIPPAELIAHDVSRGVNEAVDGVQSWL